MILHNLTFGRLPNSDTEDAEEAPGCLPNRYGKTMKRTVIISLVALGVMLGTGCMSIGTRAAKPDGTTPQYLYPGVECDFNVIRWRFVEQDRRCVTEILLWPAAATLCVIDLPFSFAVDTVCLPYDGVMMTYGGRNRIGERKGTVNKPDAGDGE